MKIFIFHVGTPTPVFETELELIRKHDMSGDTVRVLQCAGNLANCHWNQEHRDSFCARCRSKFKNGWHILRPSGRVELRQFPANVPAPSILPPVFNSVDELKRYQYDNENVGIGVASGLISICRDHRFDTHAYRNEVRRELSTAIQVYDALKSEFMEFKPDRVYVFNGRIATHLPAMLLCKRMGIDYYSYEVGGAPNSYMLWKNSSVHNLRAARVEADALWSAGGEGAEKIARLFFERQRAGVGNEIVPSFTKHLKKNTLPEGFNQDKRNIAIFSSTLDEYAALDGWENSLYTPDETAGVYKILEAFEPDDRYMFYLRVHPHMKDAFTSTSQLRDIRALVPRFRNLHVIWPAEVVDSYALVDACEKVVTFGSTIGLEAAYWGKPSILAGRSAYEELDCVYVPKTHDELVKLIKEDLRPLPADSALRYGYRVVTHGIPFEYFKQTGFQNGLARGTFDGVEIKPDALPVILDDILRFFWRIRRAIKQPKVITRKLKKYAKAIH